MNDEYNKLKAFWNQHFSQSKSGEILGKWVTDENFNRIIKEYITPNSRVLDFGCGNGWGIIEIGYTVKLNEGIGMDQSEEAIKAASLTLKASKIKKIKFVHGDENTLKNYNGYFDSIFTVNTLDVITNEALDDALLSCKKALKKGGYLIVAINPDFPFSFYEKNGYEIKNGYIFKNDILRGNLKTTQEWKGYLSRYFAFVEMVEVALVETEKTYPRRMFILKKN